MSKEITAARLRNDMLEQKHVTVVTYGDSWTYGSVAEGWYEAKAAGGNSSLITGSWSLQLKAELMRINPHVQFHNEGKGGWKSWQGNEAYESKIAPLLPDYLILNFGINDWKNDVKLADYITAMEGIIGKAKAAGCQVILWTSGPLSIRSGETYGWTQPVEDKDFPHAYSEFTTALHNLAESHDLPLADAAQDIADVWKSGTDISGWFYDAIHFKQEGHDMILQSLKKALALDTNR